MSNFYKSCGKKLTSAHPEKTCPASSASQLRSWFGPLLLNGAQNLWPLWRTAHRRRCYLSRWRGGIWVVLRSSCDEFNNAPIGILSLHVAQLFSFSDSPCSTRFARIEDRVSIGVEKSAMFWIRFDLFHEVIQTKPCMRCDETGNH